MLSRPAVAHQDILIEFDSEAWLVEARWHHCAVGRAECVGEGTSLKIGDLMVYDDCFIQWPVAHNFLIMIGTPCRKKDFRGLGIVTVLLKRVITEAQLAGISRLWGSVTAADIAETPHLFDWYRGMGFEVIHQTNDPVVKAVATISMSIYAG